VGTPAFALRASAGLSPLYNRIANTAAEADYGSSRLISIKWNRVKR
jgi:hypothetical protein